MPFISELRCKGTEFFLFRQTFWRKFSLQRQKKFVLGGFSSHSSMAEAGEEACLRQMPTPCCWPSAQVARGSRGGLVAAVPQPQNSLQKPPRRPLRPVWLCKRGRLAAQNGLFRRPGQPVLQCQTATAAKSLALRLLARWAGVVRRGRNIITKAMLGTWGDARMSAVCQLLSTLRGRRCAPRLQRTLLAAGQTAFPFYIFSRVLQPHCRFFC